MTSKPLSCGRCGDTRILVKGNKSYCHTCFEAGANSVNEFKAMMDRATKEWEQRTKMQCNCNWCDDPAHISK